MRIFASFALIALVCCGDTSHRAQDEIAISNGIELVTSDATPTTSGVKLDIPYYATSTSTGEMMTGSSGMLLDEPGSTSTMMLPDGQPLKLCGNGKLDPGEECDGDEQAASCEELGFVGGELDCHECKRDVTGCSTCGDNVKQENEECDCDDQMSCTPEQLGQKICAQLNGLWGKYHGGVLSCAGCHLDTALCEECGDQKINGDEKCDGPDLGGTSCQLLGFVGGGVLTCDPSCEFNTTGCKEAVCGDGECTWQVENSCNCWNDCPDNPNTCSPCECGGSGGACSCVAMCKQFNDCCGNKIPICG